MTLKRSLIFVVSTLFVLSGCITPAEGVSRFPPDSFQENDLIGTWEDFSEIHTDERLTLEPDHTFEQVFTFESGQQFKSNGTWELKEEANGCMYLHLKGMRYFYQSIERAESGNRYTTGVTQGDPLRYWDECGSAQIEMPDMVIMTVSSHPDGLRGIELEHMNTQRDATDIFLRLVSN